MNRFQRYSYILPVAASICCLGWWVAFSFGKFFTQIPGSYHEMNWEFFSAISALALIDAINSVKDIENFLPASVFCCGQIAGWLILTYNIGQFLSGTFAYWMTGYVGPYVFMWKTFLGATGWFG
jgi:hypothetical protein